MCDTNQILTKAWDMFDRGDYHGAEALYLQCYKQIDKTNCESFRATLMGLLYAETYLEKYDDARNYGKILLNEAKTIEDRHVAIHQLGMIERMAADYAKAAALFSEEERLITTYFPGDPVRMSANLYEQGYIALKIGSYAQAEKTMHMSLDCSIRAADNMCIGCSYRGLGEIMIATGQPGAAKDYFENALDSFAKAGDLIAVDEIRAAIQQIEV